jgi:hypothetical protein
MLLAISITSSGSTYVIVSDTFDICTGAEEAPLTGQYGEDCVWMLVETSEC